MKTKPAMLAHLFPSPMSEAIRSTFEKMKMVEDLISREKKRHPHMAEKIHQSFGILCPPVIMRDKHNRLYEHHSKELITRIVNGEDTRLGTKAEALCVLLEASLKSPLQRDHTALIDRLFREVFGRLPPDSNPEQESYPGAAQEIFNQLIKKMADPNRVCDSQGGENDQG